MLVKSGSRGSSVVSVQKELKAAGINPGPVDGDFGRKTRAAVMAYQRKHHLAVDGVVGAKTWKALTHDGFKPGGTKKPAPTRPHAPISTGPGRPSSKVQKLLAEARKHLGFHEGSGNKNPFSKALGRPPEAWCADFVSFCAKKAGLRMNTASAQQVANIIKQQGGWKGRHNPKPGDAVTFRWDGSHGWADHVGLVEKVFKRGGKTYIQTIEGNSGDRVRRKTYLATSSVINGYGTMR
ncbi:MAG: peptidoglycan-binding protein [Archangium sp.]|nr:peptidoglycan-binding protein [Archangium sp.]